MSSRFKDSVIKVVSLIPFGKVMSYGQVALYVGVPRAARQVGWILNRLESSSTRGSTSITTRSGQGKDKESVFLPWWRVVNNEGRISIKGSSHSAVEQRDLLLKEGVKVYDDFTFDIEKYRWSPEEEFSKKLELEPEYLEFLLSKIDLSKQK